MAYALQAFYDELDRLFKVGDAEALENLMLKAEHEAENCGDEAALIGIRNELGGLYRASGRLEESLALYEKVMDALRRSGLDESIHYATAQINLGDVYLAQKDMARALKAFLCAQDILNDLGLSEDYRMAALQNNISVAYASVGNFDKAGQALRHALDIIGRDPSLAAEYATTQVNLAQLKIRTGHFSEAQALLEAAITAYEKLGGDIHEGQAWQGLAQVAYFQGAYQASQAAYEKAMQAVRRYFGDGHPILEELEAGRKQAKRLAEGII